MKKNIPYLSFDGIHDAIEKELVNAVTGVVKSKWYILGKSVKNFEDDYSNFIKSKFSVGVNSGLDGLIIALKTLDIGEGDEVIVASNAYIACWNAIYAVGSTIVPVEPDVRTFNIDPELIEDKITSSTKAIMAVHLFGRICEMDKIMAIAKKHHLFVIEDNAQSQGSQYQGRISSSIGHINSTSFYPGKNLGALGDAGIITTNEQKYAEKAFSLRNYGSSEKYKNEYIGMNSRLDEMQAAILSVKLPKLDNWNLERIQIAEWYNMQLEGCVQLKIPELLKDGSNVYHIYCIRTRKRDELQLFLQENGVQTLIHYPIPPHLQKAYQFLEYQKGDFPIAEDLAKTCLSLPIYPGLSEEDVSYICDKINNFYR